MTREEASNILDDYDVNFDGHTAEEIAEAFEVAFRALEQEPCDVFDEYGNYKYSSDVELTEPNTATSMPCSNAISRIEAIKKFTYNYKGERIPDYDCDNFPIQIDMKRVKEILRELPPVNPQPKTGHWEWVQHDYNPKIGNWHCSECRSVVVEGVSKDEKSGIPLYKYCPQCGAKMSEIPTGSEPQESEDR